MAIRPEIALEAAKVPKMNLAESIGNVMKLGQLALQPQVIQQQLATAKIAEQQAQLNLQEDERKAAARKRLAELGKQYTKVDPKTGKIKVDHRAIADAAASEGYDADVIQGHLSKAISNEQAGIKTDKDRNDYLEGNIKIIDNLLRVQKDPMRAEQILQNQIERDAEVVGPEMASKFYSSRYPINTDPIQQANVNYQSTVTIPEKQALEISAAQAERTAAISYATPEARDPNSEQSRTMRERLTSQGIEVPPGASAFDIINDPVLKKQVESLIPSEGARITAAEKLTGIESTRDIVKNGVEAANKITKQIAPTQLGTLLQSKFNQVIKQYPELGILKNAISAHNQQFPDSPLDINRDSLETIIKTLENVESRLEKVGKKEKGIAIEPSLPKAIKGESQEGGTVRIMRLSDGVIKSFPKAKADAFVATGQFKIVGK
jgi:hypothetical protein